MYVWAYVHIHAYLYAHIIHIYVRNERSSTHTHPILSSHHYEMVYFLHLTDEETESLRG